MIPCVGNKSGFAHIFDDMIPDSANGKKIFDVFGGGGGVVLDILFIQVWLKKCNMQ